jgi:hypothetical protein
MTKATNNVARVAAAVAGFGLVAMSFAPLAGAQTATTTTTTTTTSSASFTRDLTIGSTGADVTALQNWLIAKGFSVPAGATGYFGAQTKAALAAYQAANGITPASGYFGPITRAKVAAMGGSTGSTGGSTSTGSLSGDEADLSDYEFRRESSVGDEGEEEVEVATAEFDVEDGDIEIQRVELMASTTAPLSGGSSASARPWDYFDAVMVLDADGDEIASMDVDDRDAWDEEDDDVYRLNITGLDYVVEEGERAEITFAFDISDSIDDDDVTNGEFDFYIEDEGIRAIDAEGIQQYIGDEDENVSFSFGEEESGDLRIRTNGDDPESATLVSDEDDDSEDYTVFVFDIDNDDDAEAEVTDLTIDVAVGSTTVALDDVLRDATLMVDGEEYDGDISSSVGADTIEFEDLDDLMLGEDDQVTFELVVSLVRDAADTTLRFSVDGDNVEAEGVRSGDDSDVSGSATSETHTVASEGITATAEEADNRSSNEADSTVNDNGVGTFRVTFDVEAIEDDVYIYRGAALGDNDATPFSAVASTTGIVYNVFQGSTASSTAPSSATVQSGADTEGNFYVVREGDTESFTLTVTVDTAVSGSYYVELDAIRFDDVNDASTANDELYIVPDDVEFESEALSLY